MNFFLLWTKLKSNDDDTNMIVINNAAYKYFKRRIERFLIY